MIGVPTSQKLYKWFHHKVFFVLEGEEFSISCSSGEEKRQIGDNSSVISRRIWSVYNMIRNFFICVFVYQVSEEQISRRVE